MFKPKPDSKVLLNLDLLFLWYNSHMKYNKSLDKSLFNDTGSQIMVITSVITNTEAIILVSSIDYFPFCRKKF